MLISSLGSWPSVPNLPRPRQDVVGHSRQEVPQMRHRGELITTTIRHGRAINRAK